MSTAHEQVMEPVTYANVSILEEAVLSADFRELGNALVDEEVGDAQSTG